MKTLEQIIKQIPKFLEWFSDQDNVFSQFNFTPTTEKVLFASYNECGGYDGDAWVLFEKDGQLYEVHGGHCSCYGLEGQWVPEAVVLK